MSSPTWASATRQKRLIRRTSHPHSNPKFAGALDAGAGVELTGLTQPEVSRIGSVKTDGFSQERLLDLLRKFGMDIEIRLHHR